MIDVRDAITAAHQFVLDLFRREDLKDLRLEEVELSADERIWRITLGWLDPSLPTHNVAIAGLSRGTAGLPRVYKVFEVDATTGAVRGMKIREVREGE